MLFRAFVTLYWKPKRGLIFMKWLESWLDNWKNLRWQPPWERKNYLIDIPHSSSLLLKSDSENSITKLEIYAGLVKVPWSHHFQIRFENKEGSLKSRNLSFESHSAVLEVVVEWNMSCLLREIKVMLLTFFVKRELIENLEWMIFNTEP